MALTKKEVESLALVSEQLRQEGAEQQIIDLAFNLTWKQYPDPTHDHLGAIKLVLDTLAIMLTTSPRRPECCVACEVEFIRNSLKALALSYARSSAEREIGKNATKPH